MEVSFSLIICLGLLLLLKWDTSRVRTKIKKETDGNNQEIMRTIHWTDRTGYDDIDASNGLFGACGSDRLPWYLLRERTRFPYCIVCRGE